MNGREHEVRTWAARLGAQGRVTMQPEWSLPRLPLWLARGGLRLAGLRPWLLPSVVHLFRWIGVSDRTVWTVAGRIRRRADWQPVWELAAAGHEAQGNARVAQGLLEPAQAEYRASYACHRIATAGDGYYFVSTRTVKLARYPLRRRVHTHWLAADAGRAERLAIDYRGGRLHAILHFPPHGTTSFPAPGLLLVHGLNGEKEDMDLPAAAFRRAGFITLAVDQPAHGESATSSGLLQADDQAAFVAGLNVLAARPEVDASRLVMLGGSLGAFWTLRTAAMDHRLRAAVALAAPYILGRISGPSIAMTRDSFWEVIGVTNQQESDLLTPGFTLAGWLGQIRCPVFLGHGTRDRLVPFVDAYDIAHEIRSPLTVHPFVGLGHEVADPQMTVAQVVVPWLEKVIGLTSMAW